MVDYSKCRFKRICKKQQCDYKCYPFVFLHGDKGETGLWASRGVPSLYEDCFAYNLPDIEPDYTRQKITGFAIKSLDLVKEGLGLFLFSRKSEINRLGTGTGKTTSACAILNGFLIKRSLEYLQGGRYLGSNPAYFVRMAEFQTLYNNQFKGTKETQELISEKYMAMKRRMKKAELLVIDDVAIRSATEAFINEFYEIVDYRVNEGLSTIYTSNVPLENLVELYGDRIVSRIEGSTYQFEFTGVDHRKKEVDF